MSRLLPLKQRINSGNPVSMGRAKSSKGPGCWRSKIRERIVLDSGKPPRLPDCTQTIRVRHALRSGSDPVRIRSRLPRGRVTGVTVERGYRENSGSDVPVQRGDENEKTRRTRVKVSLIAKVHVC